MVHSGSVPSAPQAQLISQHRADSDKHVQSGCISVRILMPCQRPLGLPTLERDPVQQAGDSDNDDSPSQGVLSAQVECLCKKRTRLGPLPQKMCPPFPGKEEVLLPTLKSVPPIHHCPPLLQLPPSLLWSHVSATRGIERVGCRTRNEQRKCNKMLLELIPLVFFTLLNTVTRKFQMNMVHNILLLGRAILETFTTGLALGKCTVIKRLHSLW